MEAGTGYWCQRREAALHAHLRPRPERGHLGTGVAEAGGAGETLSLRKVNLSSMRTSEAPLRNAGKRGDRGNRGQGHDGEVTVRGYGVGANRPAVGQEERQGGRGVEKTVQRKRRTMLRLLCVWNAWGRPETGAVCPPEPRGQGWLGVTQTGP